MMKVGDKVVKIACTPCSGTHDEWAHERFDPCGPTVVGRIYVIQKFIPWNGYLGLAFVGGITSFLRGQECGFCSCGFRLLEEMKERAKIAQGSEVSELQPISDTPQPKFL
jgi:hypothetical protein